MGIETERVELIPNISMLLPLVATLLFCSQGEALQVSKLTEEGSGSCPDHWIDATVNGLGCLYFNSSTEVNWEEAGKLCQAPENEASLLEIETELQFDFVRSELMLLQDSGTSSDWWTGGTDLGRDGHWYWAGSLAAVGDFIWYSDRPNGGTYGNCLLM